MASAAIQCLSIFAMAIDAVRHPWQERCGFGHLRGFFRTGVAGPTIQIGSQVFLMAEEMVVRHLIRNGGYSLRCAMAYSARLRVFHVMTAATDVHTGKQAIRRNRRIFSRLVAVFAAHSGVLQMNDMAENEIRTGVILGIVLSRGDYDVSKQENCTRKD